MIDINRTDQDPNREQESAKVPSTEQIRLSALRMNNALCFLMILGLIVASTVAFCITKSALSFGLLSFLSLVPTFRRRLEEFIFPISQEDLQIRLKELDVEMKRIEKQSNMASLPLFTWLRRILRKQRKEA